MARYSFEAILIRPEGVGTLTYLNIPRDVSESFGSKGQVKVRGTINGYPFRGTAMPEGDDMHFLVVKKGIRDEIQATQGNTVMVTLELDPEARQVVIPENMARAFASQPLAKDAFERLSYSHQKEYVDWIQSARKEETRQCRIEKALELLSRGAKLR
jgi:hypothetical protein